MNESLALVKCRAWTHWLEQFMGGPEQESEIIRVDAALLMDVIHHAQTQLEMLEDVDD